MRFLLTLMLVVAVCLPPALHLVTEIRRILGGELSIQEGPSAPKTVSKETAMENRSKAEATAKALLRGPTRPLKASGTAHPVARLLDVAGEFLESIELLDRNNNRNGLVGEDQLNALVATRRELMGELILSRNSVSKDYGEGKLNTLVREWFASCNDVNGFFSPPPKSALEQLALATTAYTTLERAWEAKDLTLEKGVTDLARRWREVRDTFVKLDSVQGAGRLVVLAQLHQTLVREDDRRMVREVARNWADKTWLPKGDLPLDPNVELYDHDDWKSYLRSQPTVVWKATSKRAFKETKIRYDLQRNEFGEFDLIQPQNAKHIEYISRTDNIQLYKGIKKIRPTEWSNVAHTYNRQRNRIDLWTVENLESWQLECEPHHKLVAKWKSAPKEGRSNLPSSQEFARIEAAYERAGTFFESLKDCKVLFPNPSKKDKQP